jgi:peptidoglycan hydrolase-like protein with peptidoglycan-binding domain
MAHDLDTDTTDYAPPSPAPESGNGDHRPAEARFDTCLTPRRARWPSLALGLFVGAAATLTITTWGDGGDNAEPLAEETVELTTVQVSTQDLVEEVEWSGSLSSGLTVDIAAPRAGVVIDVAVTGGIIERGDVVMVIDNEPLVALFGEIPMWRELKEGDVGGDVHQLEANLVHLGYDPDGEVTIDDEFTSTTAEMVERWEAALGIDVTGKVPMARVMVLPGATELVEAAVIGTVVRNGDTLMTVDALAVGLDVIGWETMLDTEGELSFVAEVGTPIEHGSVLYTADGTDAVAVTEIDAVSEVVFDAMSSGDVEQLESVLVFVGFDPDAQIEIDTEVDQDTAAALVRWQESVGLPATGSADASDYVIVTEAAETPYAIGEVYLDVGDRLGTGTVVMSLETPTLTVTSDIAVREIDEFDVGDIVVVEQLDETTFDAVVASIADVANPAVGQNDAPTITVTFDVLTEPDNYVSGAVTITTESSRIDDAMVVPSRALLTLREGGYAVEKRLVDGTTELVGVEIGTFDGGIVEIVSVTVGELADGDEIVVPS